MYKKRFFTEHEYRTEIIQIHQVCECLSKTVGRSLLLNEGGGTTTTVKLLVMRITDMKERISAVHTLLLTCNFVLLNFQYDTSSVLNIWYIV